MLAIFKKYNNHKIKGWQQSNGFSNSNSSNSHNDKLRDKKEIFVISQAQKRWEKATRQAQKSKQATVKPTANSPEIFMTFSQAAPRVEAGAGGGGGGGGLRLWATWQPSDRRVTT